MKDSTRQTPNAITAAVAIAAGVLVLLLQIKIGNGFGDSLDAAWGEVLNWGTAHGAQWGRDLVFTYGPLGFVTPDISFDPATYWPTLLLQIGFAAVTALLVAVNLRKLTLASGLAFVLATVVFGWSWSTSSCQIILYPLAAMTLESISRRDDGRESQRRAKGAKQGT